MLNKIKIGLGLISITMSISTFAQYEKVAVHNQGTEPFFAATYLLNNPKKMIHSAGIGPHETDTIPVDPSSESLVIQTHSAGPFPCPTPANVYACISSSTPSTCPGGKAWFCQSTPAPEPISGSSSSQ